MTQGRRPAEKEATMIRRDLMKRELSSSLVALSAEKPLASITVSELAKRCEISRGTFYNHFLDIYDLINWTFEVDVVEPLQSYITSHDKRWSGITQLCLEKMYAKRDFYCQAMRMRGQNCLRDYMRERNLASWKLLIDRYMGDTHPLDEETLDFYEQFVSRAIVDMVVEWARQGMKMPPERMALMDVVTTRGIYGIIDAANEGHKA